MPKNALVFLFSIFLFTNLYANKDISKIESINSISDLELKKMIAQMLIIGFEDSKIDENSQIVKDIKKYNLAGVILFDKFYSNREKDKNIISAKQLQKLTSSLQNISKDKLFISIDQEGGKVQRLKSTKGFLSTPSAKEISKKTLKQSKKIYDDLSSMLNKNGININFAPVLDLGLNKENFVIEKLQRSYGKNSKDVIRYSEVFSDSLKQKSIISVLKHFPGHGSSKEDSHKGFVDVSETWSKNELEPYKYFIKKNKAQMIMTAHVFNKYLDEKYPATLSYNINTKLLRENLGFEGVIISDDLQMKAITKHYTLKQTVQLAINSGVDILLFGNQLAQQNTKELIEEIFSSVKDGSISFERIIESNKRVSRLKESI